jgi:hypothetical protein
MTARTARRTGVREAVAQVVAMTGVYHASVAPKVHPIIVEERLEAEIEPDITLSGQPDLICREPNAVRDLKAGSRRPPSFQAQIGGYSLLARTHGIEIERAAIDWVQRVRKPPQPLPVTVEAQIAQAESAAANILRHITADIATFRHGDPERRIARGDPWAFMANPASNLCSATWCPAYGTDFCHEWQQKEG